MAICNEWVVKRLDNHLRQYLRLPIERDKEASKLAPFGQGMGKMSDCKMNIKVKNSHIRKEELTMRQHTGERIYGPANRKGQKVAPFRQGMGKLSNCKRNITVKNSC